MEDFRSVWHPCVVEQMGSSRKARERCTVYECIPSLKSFKSFRSEVAASIDVMIDPGNSAPAYTVSGGVPQASTTLPAGTSLEHS